MQSHVGTTTADADTIEQELQSGKICVFFNTLHTFFVPHFTVVKEALIGCVVTSLVGWLVSWLVQHGCHARGLWPNGASYAYSYYGTLIGTPTPGIQWYKFRPPGVTPNRGMGPPFWGYLLYRKQFEQQSSNLIPNKMLASAKAPYKNFSPKGRLGAGAPTQNLLSCACTVAKRCILGL